jgi:hypothetical protein
MKNTQFFFDFIQIMKNYQKGEFSKTEIKDTYKLWIKRNNVDLEELKSLFGSQTFQNFYADMAGAIRSIEFELNEELAEPKETDLSIDKFINGFTKDAIMPKKDLATLSGATETWIHKHKTEFVQSSKGGNVRSYLEWLKVYNIRFYQNFKTNYNKT